MSYSLFWTHRSEKDLAKLPKNVAQRIVDKIETISENPHRTAEPCEGYPYFHQRAGARRVIPAIDDAESTIFVLKIGPRKKVYDR